MTYLIWASLCICFDLYVVGDCIERGHYAFVPLLSYAIIVLIYFQYPHIEPIRKAAMEKK